MPKQRPLKPRELIKIMESFGFRLYRHSRGSHRILSHSDGRRVVVPFHQNKEIPKGTLRSILKDAGLDQENI